MPSLTLPRPVARAWGRFDRWTDDLWKVALSALPAALQWVAIVGGWLLVTYGVAELLVPEVWPISLGVLLLSLAGWGHLRTLFVIGLYGLRRRALRSGE